MPRNQHARQEKDDYRKRKETGAYAFIVVTVAIMALAWASYSLWRTITKDMKGQWREGDQHKVSPATSEGKAD